MEIESMETESMETKKILVIGLGLIGGSLAKALHEKTGCRDITAISRNTGELRKAEQDGVIRKGYTGLVPEVYDSDIVFLCTPPDAAIGIIDSLAGKVRDGCLLTDVCSTKGTIISHVESMDNPPRFIGGHPMAGSEKNGYMNSMPHLFENAYYVLTPCRTTDEAAIKTMEGLVGSIGAIPVVMDAKTHDRAVAAISHVPHLVASALVNLVRECDSDGTMRLLAAGGFKDITRIASSNPQLWESIIADNSRQVADLLEKYRNIIRGLEKSIAAGKTRSIGDFFSQAKDFRDTFRERVRGLIQPSYDLVADVPDKPGVIGKIATLLGDSGINIKNINVSNSREMEEGCLRITLPDEESLAKAFSLLAENGYRVYKG